LLVSNFDAGNAKKKVRCLCSGRENITQAIQAGKKAQRFAAERNRRLIIQ
jgi:hypothetical protein